MIWFTSDEHFNHANIMKYCNRPFKDVHEMNETIIANANAVVKDDDWVFHLGDFTFQDPMQFLKLLKGKHYLIKGNHDRKNAHGFQWVADTHMLNVNQEIRIFMSHYAHRIWPNSHHGSIHLYGHSHGQLPPYGKSFDCGVDGNDYKPYSLYDVLRKLGMEVDED